MSGRWCNFRKNYLSFTTANKSSAVNSLCTSRECEPCDNSVGVIKVKTKPRETPVITAKSSLHSWVLPIRLSIMILCWFVPEKIRFYFWIKKWFLSKCGIFYEIWIKTYFFTALFSKSEKHFKKILHKMKKCFIFAKWTSGSLKYWKK